MSSQQIILITGANSGLGLETIKSLLQSGTVYTILLGGRSIGKAEQAAKDLHAQFPDSHSTVETVQIDIEDDSSINRLSEHISKQYGRLDILINNAGALLDYQLDAGTLSMREMWNKSWNTNIVGTHILTYTLMPLLLKSTSPRLLFITSGTSSLTEATAATLPIDKSPPAGWPKNLGMPAYRASKCGMNMMMLQWARVLKEDGVKVFCVAPGLLATGLWGGEDMKEKFGAKDPAVGAKFVRDIVEGVEDGNVGMVVRRGGLQPW